MNARELRGASVILRPLRKSDAGALGRLLRDRRVTRTLPPRVRHESGDEFVTRVLREQHDGDGVAFVICPLGSSELIGQIRLMNWSRWEQRAEVGYWIGRSYWGRGYATEAVRLACRFGFRSMGLHRIDASVVEGNAGSMRVLEKAGFRPEGIRRLAARLGRSWAHERVFGLLRGEWERDRSSTARVTRVGSREGSRSSPRPVSKRLPLRVHR